MKPTQLQRIARVRTQAVDGSARRIRTQAGISLREAANAVGTAPSTLYRWEIGACIPRSTAALAWAELLDALTPAVADQKQEAAA